MHEMKKLLAGACLLAAAACAPAPEDAALKLPKPDLNGSYLFWTPEEQLVGYRNIEKIFPTHVIKAGGKASPLPKAARELDVRYTHDGSEWTTDRFMEATNAAGVIVVQDGQVLLERYKLGYGPGQRWTSFSVGKSMSSTLLGAAVKDGYIKSLDDMVTTYLPGLKGSAYEGVSVRNLLNMTSGVKWNEDYADPNSDVGRIRSEKSVNGSDPMVTYMARMPRETEPGAKFVYKTGETHLVGAVTRAATGKDLADYLSEKIWKPYGMEKDAVWMLDTAGHEYAGCCVSATLRDFARFGVFFMNGAKINGQGVVPDNWVKDATSPSPVSDRYGYQWWLTGGPAYNAQGIFGQQIHINPAKRLVVVVQSAWPAASDRARSTIRAAYVEAVSAAVQ